MLNSWTAKETRIIKSTSKRQITIPKSFFDLLTLQDGVTFVAQLFENGILLTPQGAIDNICDQDREQIIRQVLQDGYSGEELVKELNYRLKEYDELIASRVQEFDNDINDRNDVMDGEPGVESFNGLDIFFNQEAGTSPEKS